MIAQRTKNRVLAAALCQSQRIGAPVSSLHVFLADSLFAFRYPVATNRCVKDCPVFS